MRATRRPPPTSAALAWPRATASTRSTAAASGGCSRPSPSHRRTARRARATGAAARARASVGSRAAASPSSSSASSRRSGAWRARTATTSRSAMASSEGQQLVADPVAAVGGVGVGRVVDRRQAHDPAQRPRLVPAQAEDRPPGAGGDPGQAVEAGAPEEVEQDRLGLVVGGVAGEDVGRQHPVAGGPGPSPPGWAPAPPPPARPGTRPRPRPPPPAPRRPPPPTRPAARGRRAPR